MWYPEGGIPSVLYFKRIRLNLGADYGQFDAFDYRKGRTETRRIHSFGGDLYVDFNVFRQPASATSTLRLSFYAPSNGRSVVVGLAGTAVLTEPKPNRT